MLLISSIVMVIASLIAASLGENFGKNMNTGALQHILLLLTAGTVMQIWYEILFI